MNVKRILSAAMGILMLVSLCVPALAYTTPYTSVTSDWLTKAEVILDGSTEGYQLYGDKTFTTMQKVDAIAGDSTAAEPGALHLSSPGLRTGFTTAAYTTAAHSDVINIENGLTFDLNAKLANLPKIETGALITDEGATTANIHAGLNFDIASSKGYYNGNGKSNNELFLSFIKYDNATLGTDAALLIMDGNRNSMATEQATAYTFFFNLPEGYARYTVKLDTANDTTTFYIDGVAQKVGLTEETTIPKAALLYRTTATTNFININCNSFWDPAAPEIEGCYVDLYIDQFCVYPHAITPTSDAPATFAEEVPLDVTELTNWANALKDLDEKYYTPESWDRMQNAVDAIDFENLDTASQTQVNAWAKELEASFEAREYVGTDKLYIAQTYSSSNTATNGTAWTCGALLLTEAGYSLADYSVSGMHLDSWTRIIGVHVTDGVYRITKVVKGAYRNNVKPAIGADEVVPENGFIFAFHSNEEAAAWNPLEGGSQYAAQEFGERNALAFQNMNLEEGSLVRFENVEMNYAGDSVLSTEGTWVHRYDDAVVPNSIYRVSGQVNGSAVEGGPKYLSRDQFNDFETSSCIVLADALPNLSVSVNGNGSVQYGETTVDNTEKVNFVVDNGAIVTLTASSEGFSYWMNGKTGAIVSTDATLTFKFGLSMMELVAVYEDSLVDDATKYPVTFKDGLTGKVVATVEVAEGELVDASLVPEMDAVYGYTFRGWFVNGNLSDTPDTYVITGATTFVARYNFDDSNLFKLTVKVGDYTKVYNRRYGSVARVVTSDTFDYWTLDGSYLTSAKTAQLSMPNRDVIVEAVSAATELEFAPTTSLLSCFVDDKGNLMTTFNRNVPEGYTFVESGVLMTRKAEATDLVVDTLVNTVTRGVSSADESVDVFGFTKPGMFAKTGTWLVRGYLSYKDASGTIKTVYTVTCKVEVGTSGAAQGQIMTTDVAFVIDGKYDPTLVGTEIFNAVEYSDVEYKAFFPSTTQADDGTLMVVYYYGPGHAKYKQTEGKLEGVLHLQKSYDNGETWTEPEVLVDLTDEDKANGDYNRESRDPNLQKLSDGTIVLTFPVRAPIGKAGMNGSTPNDYWYERAYYMTSTDNGKTWSDMKEIECDYLSGGEPFLYDDKTRTTACWVKNGSIAELSNGDLIFPLYGAVDCSTRAILQTVVVKAKNNGDGTLTFYKDWADGKDAAQVAGEGLGDELAVWAYGDTVYGLARNKINSDKANNTGGIVYRSLDAGKTWEEYAVEHTSNDCINQPNFAYLDGDRVLVNYSVPMASVSTDNGAALASKRSARPIYGKIFDLTTGNWDEYSAKPVFDVKNAGQTNNDMGNPASVLLDDGRIFTVGYSNPSNGPSIIVGQYTDLKYYDPNASTGDGGSAIPDKVLLEDNFDSVADGQFIYVNNAKNVTGGSRFETVSLNDKFDAAITGYSYRGEAEVYTQDGKVVLRTNNGNRTNSPYAALYTKEEFSGDMTIQFNYAFNDINVANRNHIFINFFDDTQKEFYITPGKVQIDSDTVLTLGATQDTVYTVKAMLVMGNYYLKVWEADKAEPAEWTLSAAAPAEALTSGKISIEFEGRSSSTSKPADRTVTIDNLKITESKLSFAGLTETVKVQVGKSAWIKSSYATDLELSGVVDMTAYSDNPGVATLNADGSVTGVSKGICRIVATLEGKTYYTTVIVC